MSMRTLETDVLILGSGIAGLSYALKAAAHGRVLVLTKKDRAESNTNFAQGGIAAVMGPDDSVALHVRDTLVAGAGLCHTTAVRALAREGPARVRDLIEWGVRFTEQEDALALGREGGHSRRRIVHAHDLTGREIERALLATLAENPAVELLEDQHAAELLVGVDPATGVPRCLGALAFDHRTGVPLEVRAAVVLLATGGWGQAFRHTTNPAIATGDGVAMAYRAGAILANLEFVQFHPTALYPAGERAFLVSEAVRGEGAVLRHMDGTDLMAGLHPQGSLAPRDVVARAIDAYLKSSGAEHALLDVTSMAPAAFRARFPGLVAGCAERGVDVGSGMLPVVPAAHYVCGGVRTDAAGRTSLAGLYASGEVACTGVHGANRLASNSLLEAVVYSHRAAGAVPMELARVRASVGTPEVRWPVPSGEAAADATERERWRALRDELRSVLWEDAGIVRNRARLERAAERVDALAAATETAYARHRLDVDLVELRNLCTIAALLVCSARARRESRGLHHHTDHPFRDNERHLRDSLIAARGIGENQS